MVLMQHHARSGDYTESAYSEFDLVVPTFPPACSYNNNVGLGLTVLVGPRMSIAWPALLFLRKIFTAMHSDNCLDNNFTMQHACNIPENLCSGPRIYLFGNFGDMKGVLYFTLLCSDTL